MKIIYLIGFRAAGKTTLGKALAKKKNFYFFDCDEIFEQQNKMSILDFVKINGEKKFRELEFEILKNIPKIAQNIAEFDQKSVQEKICLIATGGGFVDYPPSLDWMREKEHKIFFDVPAVAIWERIKDKPERLRMGLICNQLDLQRIYHSRVPLYQSLNPQILPLGVSLESDLEKLESIIQVEF